jgi:Mg-chelatase subunit ChlD
LRSSLRPITIFLVLVCSLTGWPGSLHLATAEGELQVSARSVSIDDAKELQFLAKVLDQNDRPVTGLGMGNFSVTAGERIFSADSVQSVVDAQVAISSLLVIDTSGSMEGSPLDDARQAASQYIGSQDAIDSVAIMAFSDDVRLVSDYSQDFVAVQNTLGGLVAGGNTSLFESVVAAAQSISARGSARSVVILISDGENFGPSTTTREQALTAARDSGVPFYVIGIGPTIDEEFLRELSDATQGEMYVTPVSDQLAALFGQIAEVLRSEYLVTVSLSSSGLQGDTDAMVEVRTAEGSGGAPITIHLPLVPVVAPATPLPTAAVAVAQPVPEAGGSDLLQWVLLGVLALLLLSGFGAYAKQWYDRRVPNYHVPSQPIGAPPARDEGPAVSRDSPHAVLRQDSGQEFKFSGMVTLGVDASCTFRLPIGATEFGHGEVRVWFANQRYLVHDISPRSRIRVNGRPVTWSFLTDGDEIDVSGVKMSFRLESATPAQRY